ERVVEAWNAARGESTSDLDVSRTARAVAALAARSGDARAESFVRELGAEDDDARGPDDPFATALLCIAQLPRLCDVADENGSKPERVAHLIARLEAEVGEGGLGQFFLGGAGQRWAETVSTLNEIGAPRSAEIVRKAAALLGASRALPGDRAR